MEGAILNSKRCDSKVWSIAVYKLENALDLITRQQAKIEELVGNNDKLNIELQSMRSAANSLKMHYEEVQAEIERLKTELDFAKAFRKETDAEFSLMHRKYGNMLKAAKAEAYKEFARRLKCGVPQETGVIRCSDVDNLVKEMVGDDNVSAL